MNDAFCKAILEKSGKTIASASELRELRDAQKRYDIAFNGLTQFNRQSAEKDWASHKQDLVEAIKENGNLRELSALSNEDFHRQYAMKSEACREKMRTVCQEILPLADKICDRFVAIATSNAVDAAEAELKAHTLFGIAHKPSSLVVAFGKAAEFARSRCPKSMYAAYGPKQLLPYLDI